MKRRLQLAERRVPFVAQSHGADVAVDEVLFIDDVAREIKASRRTIQRLRRFGAFPIPELDSIDKRPRWSRSAVERWKAGGRMASPAVSARRAR